MFKKFTFFSLVMLFFGQMATAQVMISFEFVSEHTKEELQDILTDFGIPAVLAPVYYDIEVYKITYETPNGDGSAMTTATGAACFPKGYICNSPIASYLHGTTSSKTGVPSYGSTELVIGQLWAGRGYITSLPDYLGLGDSPGMHPYVHAKSEATASIDMIRATKELSDELGHSFNDELFLFGYSQGGHSAVATFKEIQENLSDEMTVTACYGMSGPYDVAGVQTDFINSGQPYATPGYLPYVFLGYQSVYGNLYQNSLSEVLVAPYDTTLPPLFDGTHGMGEINDACTPVPTDMVVPSYQADFETNPDHPFRVALEDNTLTHWKPESPIRLYYCTEDEQVFYENSEVARDSFLNRGAPDVHAVNFGAYDHGGCVQFCLFNALLSMDSFATGPTVLLDYAVATEESSAGAMDGSITLSANADAGNLSFAWNTGATGPTLENIGAGDYMVTVTSDIGCERVFEFNFDQLLSNDSPILQQLDINPNPATDFINIRLEEYSEYRIEMYDLGGRLVKDINFAADQSYTLDVSDLNDGMHFIQMTDLNSGQQHIGKVIVE